MIGRYINEKMPWFLPIFFFAHFFKINYFKHAYLSRDFKIEWVKVQTSGGKNISLLLAGETWVQNHVGRVTFISSIVAPFNDEAQSRPLKFEVLKSRMIF